jgi:hypothetical protein
MTTHIVPRYPPTFRQDELHLICAAAQEGRSLCLVGLAGIGKTNVTNLLRFDPYGYKARYLNDHTGAILFPFVDGNVWDRTPRCLWEQMLADLSHLTDTLSPPPRDEKILQMTDEQRAFSALRNRIQWLTGEHGRQIVFILDDFDLYFQVGPLTMLEQLYTLRSAGNRNKLSYLIFTKKLPVVLGRTLPLDGNSKFYDLFKRDIYPLRPYGHDDVHQMLLFLNENAGRTLRARDLVVIDEKLSGGHAGLAKVLFNTWRRVPPPEDANLVDHFAGQSDVLEECRRIYDQLHVDEREAAQRFAQAKPTNPDLLALLIWRGLLKPKSDRFATFRLDDWEWLRNFLAGKPASLDDYQWFSPFMGKLLEGQGR